MPREDTQLHSTRHDEEMPAATLPLRLVVLRGNELGRRYVADDGALIGRSSSCDVVVNDACVSRKQARIDASIEGLFITDTSGRKSLRVNGVQRDQCRLKFGDKIEVGATILLVTPHDVVERERLEQQRIQALGYLSSGIAHDFNNMLGVILSTLGYVRELGARPLDDPEVLECLDDLTTAGERSAELVKRILDFARRERETHDLLDFGNVCADVVRLTTRAFPGTIRVETGIERNLWLRGARAQLSQMIMNLCINACDAMPDGGVLRIRGFRDGAHVRFVVEDTGIGMDGATRERLFERFFTTKSEKGTGLGLATVSEIARWHGASISVESKLNVGTRFTVTFPASDPTASVRTRRSTTIMAPRPTARRARVMVVDDDRVVRRAIVRILRAHHDVTEVDVPANVPSAYLETKPDLVLLDLDMAGLDGREVWRRLREVDPDAPVAFVSGHGGDLDHELRTEGALGFLQKPFGSESLRSFILEILDGSTS